MYLEWVKPFITKDDNCLEIGCASGYFLNQLKSNVKNVAGMEAHLLLHKYCEDLGFSMIRSVDGCQDAEFDRVFMFFLLEHLGDPVSFLSGIRRILRKNGTLFIVVPNADDALLSLYDIPEFRNFYFTPAHQYYYSEKTLSVLLAMCGFSISKIIPKQRYDLSNHMHWMQFRKPGGFGKYNHIFSEKLRNEYAENLKDNFLCDTLLAVVTK
nr:class I SAM-dependent methyltransferase [uncultured Methanoregula sp.]